MAAHRKHRRRQKQAHTLTNTTWPEAAELQGEIKIHLVNGINQWSEVYTHEHTDTVALINTHVRTE